MSDMTINVAGEYLHTDFVAKGIGGWRALYTRFIRELEVESVLEVGSGTPDFLCSLDVSRRVAIDIGDRFADDFSERGILFARRDLEHDALDGLGEFDVAVCSDVFEHLLDPASALDRLANVLRPRGILFSHVPNEFRFGHLARVAFGGAKASEFHRSSDEWNDPHIRRFSPNGYRRFLERCFPFNLALTDMRYRGVARALRSLGIAVPYGLQGGPTFASTGDERMFERLRELKRDLSRA